MRCDLRILAVMLAVCGSAGCIIDAGTAHAAKPVTERFSGSWSWNVSLCEGGDGLRSPCAHPQTDDNDTGSCGTYMVLQQHGARLCGVWTSGCSSGEGSTGTLVGEVHGKQARVRIGDDLRGEDVFPHQTFVSATLSITGQRLRQVIDGQEQADAEVFTKDKDRIEPLLERPDFLHACVAGTDYDTVADGHDVRQ